MSDFSKVAYFCYSSRNSGRNISKQGLRKDLAGRGGRRKYLDEYVFITNFIIVLYNLIK